MAPQSYQKHFPMTLTPKYSTSSLVFSKAKIQLTMLRRMMPKMTSKPKPKLKCLVKAQQKIQIKHLPSIPAIGSFMARWLSKCLTQQLLSKSAFWSLLTGDPCLAQGVSKIKWISKTLPALFLVFQKETQIQVPISVVAMQKREVGLEWCST
jgi:hypothetical protein